MQTNLTTISYQKVSFHMQICMGISKWNWAHSSGKSMWLNLWQMKILVKFLHLWVLKVMKRHRMRNTKALGSTRKVIIVSHPINNVKNHQYEKFVALKILLSRVIARNFRSIGKYRPWLANEESSELWMFEKDQFQHLFNKVSCTIFDTILGFLT